MENDCFWTLDVQWHEDSRPWCTRGRAVLALGWLRLMAYNLLQQARRRHLRRKLPSGERQPPPSWRNIFTWVAAAWRRPISETDAALG